jgi:hypothetical protein
MRKIRNAQHFLSILLVVIIISCTRDATIVPTIPPTIDSTATVKYKGSFVNGPYGSVTGNVEIVKQDTMVALLLKNFSSSSGPDLHVYLSEERLPANFIDLGSLRTNSGDQAYSIPNNTNLTQYKYALIHCKAYNHLFGSAALQ